jgi:DNA-binding transcriptional ArsR family regulator
MQNLNPTLWRTCRMLAGATRIHLLRQLHDHPGQNIATLADAVGISQSYASQEMRRIQSRGLLQATHQGASLIYRPVPDPQVSSAAPLLKAVTAALGSRPSRQDDEMAVIAAGLAHERRIAMVRSLMQSPKTPSQLLAEVPMAPCSFQLHLRTLLASGFVKKQNRQLTFATPAHPLAQALARLLRQGAAR